MDTGQISQNGLASNGCLDHGNSVSRSPELGNAYGMSITTRNGTAVVADSKDSQLTEPTNKPLAQASGARVDQNQPFSDFELPVTVAAKFAEVIVESLRKYNLVMGNRNPDDQLRQICKEAHVEALSEVFSGDKVALPDDKDGVRVMCQEYFKKFTAGMQAKLYDQVPLSEGRFEKHQIDFEKRVMEPLISVCKRSLSFVLPDPSVATKTDYEAALSHFNSAFKKLEDDYCAVDFEHVGNGGPSQDFSMPDRFSSVDLERAKDKAEQVARDVYSQLPGFRTVSGMMGDAVRYFTKQ